MKYLSPLILIVMLMISASGWAGEPLTVDDAHPVARGEWELSSGINWSHQQTERHFDVPLSLSYGLLSKLEVGACFGGHLHDRISDFSPRQQDIFGFTDLDVGLKWQALSHEKWAFALISTVVLPSGDETRGLGCGQTQTSVTAALSYSLDRLNIDLNTGHTATGSVWQHGAAARFLWQPGMELVAEIFTENSPDSPVAAKLSAGLVRELRSSASFFLSLGRGLTTATPDFILKLGLIHPF